MSLIRHRCIVCDAPVPNQYAPAPNCEGYTCPKSSAPPPGVIVAAPHNKEMKR